MLNKRKSRLMQSCCLGLSALAMGQFTMTPVLAAQPGQAITPIKHVIVIIGENRSFDHVFATYQPKGAGESVNNLLSEGIIQLDSSKNAVAGPNFAKAHQQSATDAGPADAFRLTPPKTNFPNDQLPSPLVGGPKVSYIPNACGSSTPITSCEASLTLAQESGSGGRAAAYQAPPPGG